MHNDKIIKDILRPNNGKCLYVNSQEHDIPDKYRQIS